MPIVDVHDLTKIFSLKRKEAGLRGSVQSIFRPEFQRVEAVKCISFSLEPGELLAFIGPNGAGKSTTIKMLTGILYPCSGQAQVLGLVPWRDRRRLAYRIGSVFGQKPQLWYHLPPIDTFNLFANIYELDDRDFKRRAAFLIEAFDIADLVNTPVRKLSPGNSYGLAEQAANAMLTLAMYPSDIFQGAVRFLMLTVLPAAFVGAVPLNIVRALDVNGLALLAVAAALISLVSGATFYLGLRRYESGSAMNVNV